MKSSLRKMRGYMYEGAIPTDHFPWTEDWDTVIEKKEQVHDRRSRILMRGVKVGQRKPTTGDGKMGIFDTKKN